MKRVRKWLLWSLVFLVSVLSGALGFAYFYVTKSETIAQLIESVAPRFFPGCEVRVSRALMRPLLGEVTLTQLTLRQPLDDRAVTTAQVAWINIKHDLRSVWNGRLEPREIVLVQPVLRLTRRRDGSWNLDGLLADPWPGIPLRHDPRLRINAGTIELVDADGQAPMMILRDVVLDAHPTEQLGVLSFEASARGGPFERLRVEGFLAYRDRRVVLTRGDLTQLALAETFCQCLPQEVRDQFHGLGLTGGLVDVSLSQLHFAPGTPRPIDYTASIQLRGGTLDHPALPDALSQLEGAATIHNGSIVIEHASGRNGRTLVRLKGRLDDTRSLDSALELFAEVTDLEIDDRLFGIAPEPIQTLGRDFQLHGQVDATFRISRQRPGDPMSHTVHLLCKDVGLNYRIFPYPVEHAQGSLLWEADTVRVDMRSLIGGAWARAQGTITRPGPDCEVQLVFSSSAFPIDETLMRALPAEILPVVEQFHPTGTVRGTAEFGWDADRPRQFDLHLLADLNPGCSMRWDSMPYLIRDLTGHLDLTPEHWVFTDMVGRNGPAVLRASGEAHHFGPDRDAVNLTVAATNLPFDEQLRDALPPEWQSTWTTLNPSGMCQVDARISVEPGQEPHYHMTIVPVRDQTRVKLVLTPAQPKPDQPETMELPPMENISGTFVFDDGVVSLKDVDFQFREAPVHCTSGSVILRDTGEFDLQVQDLMVTKLRLDAELRRRMPPVMAQFAQRLDDGRPFWLRGDLRIGWSGQHGEPARVYWNDTTVVFDGNTIQNDFPLENVQGQFEQASGWSDGQQLELTGVLNIESVELLGQQISKLQGPVTIREGWARLDPLSAQVLGGQLTGGVALSLDTTPRYRASVALVGADLSHYTRTLPGRQSMQGLVSGQVELQGQGQDLRSLTATAWARVTEGDLGQLPIALRWVKVPNFRPPTRTAFDTAELRVMIADGEARIEPLRLTGDAFSLAGGGTVRLQGDRRLDLRLSPVVGRDERQVPVIGDLVREASGRVFDLHVTGTLDSPTIRPQPLPDVWSRASDAAREIAERREQRLETGPQ